jgi:tRNA(Ile)-lysidine synthase
MPKNGFLVRPLLGFTREEVLRAVQENQIAYMEDSSNASVKYARNKIRLEVIPKLKELNPALEQTFQQHLRHFKELEQLMEAKIAEVRSSLLEQRGSDIYISLEKVRQLNPQHLLLSGLLKPFGFSEAMVDDIISVLDKHAGRSFETGTHRMVLDRNWLILSAQETNHHEDVIIQEDMRRVRYNDYDIAISHSDEVTVIKNNPFAVSVDADLLMYPLRVRSWQQSDYFYPLGMKTRKKLSDFFINQKVPLHHKSRIPIVVNGNGDIVWVGGYRPDERYKVKGQTKKITIFEIQDYNEQ